MTQEANDPLTEDRYCREIEGYLCRKNDGHLIRVVGPSFAMVCEWARKGVPLKVAFRGIDRYFDRYYARGKRRRPVQIAFCEADIMDVFDEWRRATGVATALDEGGERQRRRPSLKTHLERMSARLTALASGAGIEAAFETTVNRIVRQLDSLLADAAGARGEAKERLAARLAELDAELLEAARRRYSAELHALETEAETELAPFRGRMPETAFEKVLQTAVDRLLRERAGLPRLQLD
jgi:hypothetical protein